MGRHWREKDGSSRYYGEAITSQTEWTQQCFASAHAERLKGFPIGFSSGKVTPDHSYPTINSL